MQSHRREFVLALGSLLVASLASASINSVESGPSMADVASHFATYELTFDTTCRSMQRARVYVPRGLMPDREWPVAILLHGYAQALERERALAAWRAEYEVLEAYTNLESATISSNSALSAARAAAISVELEVAPFRGMVLVTPVTPIPYFQRDLGKMLTRYTEWIHHRLLPNVAALAPISTNPEHLGLAGVSMGGLVGLEMMWRFPERFGAYCGIQIAIKESEAYRYARLLQRAFGTVAEGRGRPIRVVTATRDTYRWSNQAFYQALVRKKLDASLELRQGAHNSRWMRQAGSLESLLWLERTLRADVRVEGSGEF